MRRIKLVVAVGVVMAALLALGAGPAMAEIEFDGGDGGDLSFGGSGVFLAVDSDDIDDDIFDDDDDGDDDEDIFDDDDIFDDNDNDVDIDLD
jgi:hypothetical protein